MKLLTLLPSITAATVAFLLPMFGFFSNARELILSPSHLGGTQISYIQDGTEVIVAYLDQRILSTDSIRSDVKELLLESGSKLIAENSEYQRSQRSSLGEPIEPLIKTKWNQGFPYNLYTPEFDGIHAPTGCVATAIAQILNYYQFPKHFDLEPQDFSFPGVPSPYNVDWSLIPQTEFDYDEMLDEYSYDEDGNPNFTSENAEAVSKLMLYCGVTMKTSYSKTASAATNWFSKYVLETFFNYDTPKVKTIWNYGDDDQSTYTISELRNARPVLYGLCRVGSTGGHAVVCDGYLEGDLFHFNFGWGGYMDGYYNIKYLSLNQNQQYYPNEMIYNIMPRQSGEAYVSNTSVEETDTIFDVYTLSGSKIASAISLNDFYNSFPPGCYILKSDKTVKKVCCPKKGGER